MALVAVKFVWNAIMGKRKSHYHHAAVQAFWFGAGIISAYFVSDLSSWENPLCCFCPVKKSMKTSSYGPVIMMFTQGAVFSGRVFQHTHLLHFFILNVRGHARPVESGPEQVLWAPLATQSCQVWHLRRLKGLWEERYFCCCTPPHWHNRQIMSQVAWTTP